MHVALSAAMVGALLSIAGLLVPSHLGPIQTAWLGLAGLLSRVTTPIFMGLVYFGVLTPTGVLIRLFGRNPLTRHHRNDSLWVSRDSEDSRQGSMKRQF